MRQDRSPTALHCGRNRYNADDFPVGYCTDRYPTTSKIVLGNSPLKLKIKTKFK